MQFARCCAGLAKIPRAKACSTRPSVWSKAYRDWFSGYTTIRREYLRRTFEEVAGYDEMIVLRDIEFEIALRTSHGADHRPRARRLSADQSSRRHQQAGARGRRLRAPLPGAGKTHRADRAVHPEDVLKPRGVGVVVDAVHECMTTRGVHKRGVSMITSQMLGTFREDARTRAEFLRFIDIHAGR